MDSSIESNGDQIREEMTEELILGFWVLAAV